MLRRVIADAFICLCTLTVCYPTHPAAPLGSPPQCGGSASLSWWCASRHPYRSSSVSPPHGKRSKTVTRRRLRAAARALRATRALLRKHKRFLRLRWRCVARAAQRTRAERHAAAKNGGLPPSPRDVTTPHVSRTARSPPVLFCRYALPRTAAAANVCSYVALPVPDVTFLPAYGPHSRTKRAQT